MSDPSPFDYDIHSVRFDAGRPRPPCEAGRKLIAEEADWCTPCLEPANGMIVLSDLATELPAGFGVGGGRELAQELWFQLCDGHAEMLHVATVGPRGVEDRHLPGDA